MAVPEMIWSASNVTHMSAWMSANESPAAIANPEPDPRAAAQISPHDPGKRRDKHEAFESDVYGRRSAR